MIELHWSSKGTAWRRRGLIARKFLSHGLQRTISQAALLVTLTSLFHLEQFFQVIEYVLKKRLPESVHSDITIGKANCFLDEMANLRAYANKNREGGTVHHNHGWRKSMKGGNDTNSGEEKISDSNLRADWLRRVMSNGLSPLEHKWLVRILQKKVSRWKLRHSISTFGCNKSSYNLFPSRWRLE